MGRQVHEDRPGALLTRPVPRDPAEKAGALSHLARRAVAAMGLEMVHVEQRHAGRQGVVRLLVDHKDGVSLDDCARVSAQFGALLETADIIPHSYTLEVSSPGLNRPLFTQADYRRFTNHMVKITTHAPLDGRRHFRGRLTDGHGEEIVLQSDDGAEIFLPFRAIARGRLEFDPGQELRPAARKRSQA